MKESKSKFFIFKALIGTIVVVALTSAINMYVDIFGLFREVDDRKLGVHHDERVSKYLLSLNYIPSKFNALVVGPSLSANLRMQGFSKPIIPYNASIMGASLAEMEPIVRSTVERGEIKHVIICLHPYLLQSEEIFYNFDKKTYYGAFNSLGLYQTYALKFIRDLHLWPSKFPKNQITWNGSNQYEDLFRVPDVEKRITEEIVPHEKEIKINEQALKRLVALRGFLKEKGVDMIGYFHPLPFEIYKNQERQYNLYEEKIRSTLPGLNIVDFNIDSFKPFTGDYSNYIDHGHLSLKGQKVVVDSLNNFILNNLKR